MKIENVQSSQVVVGEHNSQKMEGVEPTKWWSRTSSKVVASLIVGLVRFEVSECLAPL